MGRCGLFLWIVLLLVGPRLASLRTFLEHVRSITTDMGTEFGVRESADVLPTFLQAFGVRCPRGEPHAVFVAECIPGARMASYI